MKKLQLLYVAMMIPAVGMATESFVAKMPETVPAYAGVSTPMITEVPEGGRTVYYNRTSDYFYVSGGNVYKTSDETGIPSEIVYYDNGDVYMRDPISHMKYGTYVKGTLNNGEITLSLPQPIREAYSYTYSAARLYLGDLNGSAWYRRDPDSQTIKFYVGSDGTVSMEKFDLDENNNPDYIMGMLIGEGWSGYGEYNVVFTPTNKDVAVPPASVETADSWVLESDNQTPIFVKVAINGDNLYLGNFYSTFNNSFIVGKISDGKVVFNNGQFLGYESETGYFLYVYGGHVVEAWDEDLQLTVQRMTFDDNITFSYDAANKTLSSEQCLVINASDEKVAFRLYYENPKIHFQNPDVAYVNPKAPVFGNVAKYNGNSGYVTFDIPVMDENNNLMVVDNIYYEFYVNGNLFTFYKDEYPYLPEDSMTRLSFMQNDNKMIFGAEVRHVVYYYIYGAESVGVRSVYIDEDGTERTSEIVTYNFDESGIADIVGVEEPVATVFYDLTGRRSESPENGIYIKVDTFADGTVRTAKVAEK